MLSELQLTLNEAFQLLALAPCVFLTLYFLIQTKNKRTAVIPVLYFISLSAELIYRLMPAMFVMPQNHPHIAFLLLLIDSMMSAISFLLILQMTFNKIPSRKFWAILAVPAFASSHFIHAFINNVIACTSDMEVCIPSESVLHLNMAAVSSFIFLLLTVLFSRISTEIGGDAMVRKHKYWLIISIIIFNIFLIATDIVFSTKLIVIEQYIFVKTMIKIAFIYMIMTSVFRVFNEQFTFNPVNITTVKIQLTEYEKSVAVRAEKILENEKIYREPGFNRASFAKKLSVREHVLSRIINMHFNKSFSELANEYRIKEAKELLTNKELSVTTISYDVGFSSITSFNRVFKEMTGQSPSEFRDSPPKNVTGELQHA